MKATQLTAQPSATGGEFPSPLLHADSIRTNGKKFIGQTMAVAIVPRIPILELSAWHLHNHEMYLKNVSKKKLV